MNTRFVGKPLCRVIIAVVMAFFSLNAMSQYFSDNIGGINCRFEVISPTTVKLVKGYITPTYPHTYSIPTTATRVRPGSQLDTFQVVSIGDSAFYNEGGTTLTGLIIPSSITSIGNHAFEKCSGLSTVDMQGVTSIGAYAFSQTALTSVTIPNSCSYLGAGAFKFCFSLTSVSIGSGLTTLEDDLFFGTDLSSVVIPNGITSIGNGTFAVTEITSVTIPHTVTSIGGRAFAGCTSLSSFTIPGSVTTIGEGAFYNTALTTAIIPNGVTTIGEEAFKLCRDLTMVTIPNSVTSIGKEAFSGHCNNLITLNFNAVNCEDLHDTTFSTTLTNLNIGNEVMRIPANFIKGCSNLTSVILPTALTYIGDSAFYNCSGLTSITIPNRVTSIGNSAFSYCRGLTTVTIPHSVTSIGEAAFSYCYGLRSAGLSNAIGSIKKKLFHRCLALISIDIPNSVTSIGDNAFSESGLISVVVPDAVTTIGKQVFAGCPDLRTVSIGTGLTSMGLYPFQYSNNLTTLNFNAINCQDLLSSMCANSLTTLNIGNDVQTIPAYFCKGCSNLNTITIGSSVASIRDSAFYGCNNISSVVSFAMVPPTVNSEALPYPNSAELTVPCGSYEAYTDPTSRWNLYFSPRIMEAPLSFDFSVSANNDAYGSVEVETLSCAVRTLTAKAKNGYVFSKWNDGNTDNPRTVTITSDSAFVAIFNAEGEGVSLQEVNTKEFALYPNPAKNFVNLEFEALQENCLLQVLDLSGRSVKTFDLKAGQESLQINVGDLSKGVYTIKLGNTARKLIVE